MTAERFPEHLFFGQPTPAQIARWEKYKKCQERSEAERYAIMIALANEIHVSVPRLQAMLLILKQGHFSHSPYWQPMKVSVVLSVHGPHILSKIIYDHSWANHQKEVIATRGAQPRIERRIEIPRTQGKK